MADDAEECGAKEGRAGNGEDPGEDDTPRHAPAHGREAARCANTYDGARAGVRGADGYAEMRGGHYGDSPGGFGGKPAERRGVGDALPHARDDATAAGHGAAGHD